MSGALLEAKGLCKRYGALVANDNISLTVAPGELHAIIGPNGAGKTTLIGQLTGQIRPDEGRILFRSEDITDRGMPARVQFGLSRSFQISSIFPSFNAECNVALPIQAKAGHSFRFWTPAVVIESLRGPARELLGRVGLGERGATRASVMAHGERRQLEVAMALASQPSLLLLDEPMAGLGAGESARMVAFLKSLKGRFGILLVEHDMNAVFALADRISVLASGRVIVSGTPEEIRSSREVREVYLGEEFDA
ncbi:MAG: ABC transporter ATP-binding protein [Betaproteobacteria bacterium]|nr:ABC transporter ATP-binding protein [Betaproteobacteria bacterium]